MPTKTSNIWRQRLNRWRIRRVQFAGGDVQWEPTTGDVASDTPPEEGVQYIGLDHIAIAREGVLYRIPLSSLRRLWGTRRPTDYAHKNESLIAIVRGWIDPDVNPDGEDEIIWYTFIGRDASVIKGAIEAVDEKKGIQLRTAGGERRWIAWDDLGATTELLE